MFDIFVKLGVLSSLGRAFIGSGMFSVRKMKITQWDAPDMYSDRINCLFMMSDKEIKHA
jgi:hypothetical protein